MTVIHVDDRTHDYDPLRRRRSLLEVEFMDGPCEGASVVLGPATLEARQYRVPWAVPPSRGHGSYSSFGEGAVLVPATGTTSFIQLTYVPDPDTPEGELLNRWKLDEFSYARWRNCGGRDA